MIRALALSLVLLMPGVALAEGLMGREVLLRVETWDDPADPLLVSRDYIGRVGEGPEFGVTREVQGYVGVVPVLVDISADRIAFSWPNSLPDRFAEAVFNGYVLTFSTECLLLAGASIDHVTTTLPLDDSALILTPQSLSLHVGGQKYGPHARIAVHLDVRDCAMS